MTSSRQPNVATAVARKWDVRCAINMGAGFVDLSTYRRPVTVSGAMEIRPAKGGLANKQGTSGPFVTVPTGLASGQGLTFVAVTNGNASSTPVGVSNTNNGNYGPSLIITAGVPALKFRGSSGTIVSMTGPTIATGGDLAVACTWLPGVGIRGSFNGQEVVSAALADKTGNVLSSTLFFGNSTTVNTYFAAVIAGAVSDAELRQLSASPWILLADQSLKTIYEQAASGGPATVTAGKGASTWAGKQSSLSLVVNAAAGAVSWSGKSSPIAANLNAASGATKWDGKSASFGLISASINAVVGDLLWAGVFATVAAGIASGGGGDFAKRKRRILIGDREYLATPAEAAAIVSRMQDIAPIAAPAPKVAVKARGAAKVLVESLVAAELLRIRVARELEEDDEEVMMLLCA